MGTFQDMVVIRVRANIETNGWPDNDAMIPQGWQEHCNVLPGPVGLSRNGACCLSLAGSVDQYTGSAEIVYGASGTST